MGRERTREKRDKARVGGKRRRNLGIAVLVVISVVIAVLLLWSWTEGDNGDSGNGELEVVCRVSLNCPGCECKNVVRSFEEGRVVVRVYLWIPLNYTESVVAEFTVNLTNGETEYNKTTYDLSGRSPDDHPTQEMVLPPYTDLVDLEVRIHTCR